MQPDGLTAPARRRWLAGAAALGGSALSPSALGLSGLGLLLGGCASAPPTADQADLPPATAVQPFSAAAAGQPPAGWRPYALRRDLVRTRYAVVSDGPRRVLHARASASATGLRCAVDIDPAAFGQLQFSWRVSQVPTLANVARADRDDCPARLILAFGGDDSRLPLRERLFYEQVELFTGQRLPFATLMYVWDGGSHAVETVHRNHRSERIQYLTVESGPPRAGQWLHYRRDIVADYRRVFGEAPGRVLGVGVLTDADALKLDLEAWYGDIRLAALPPTPAATG